MAWQRSFHTFGIELKKHSQTKLFAEKRVYSWANEGRGMSGGTWSIDLMRDSMVFNSLFIFQKENKGIFTLVMAQGQGRSEGNIAFSQGKTSFSGWATSYILLPKNRHGSFPFSRSTGRHSECHNFDTFPAYYFAKIIAYIPYGRTRENVENEHY